MRAVIYLRISKDATGQALGVERQRQDCLAYTQHKKWEVAHIYTDNDTSATKTRKPRPQFERMLKAVQAGDIDVIVSYHLDRLLRRLAELERVFTICQEHGTYIITVADGVDTSNDGGRLVARLLASVAQGEVERKSSRQKRAMRQLAEKGKGWGGRAFGYKAGDTGLATKEANAIRRAYSEILAGATLYAIAADWNRRGLRTTKNGGNLWSGATVKQVLTNPRNAGLRAHNGEIVGKAAWPAIVDEETWQSAQIILAERAKIGRPPAGGTTRRYLLSGIVMCGVCGHKLSAGGRSRAPVYACKQAGCYKVARDMRQVDDIVAKLIKARLAMPDAAEFFTPTEVDVRHLYEELKAKRVKLDQIAIDYADDILTREQAKIATRRLESAIERIESEIGAAARPSSDFSDFDPTDTAAWFDSLPSARQRALIRLLCTVTINPVGSGRKTRQAVLDSITVNWAVDN